MWFRQRSNVAAAAVVVVTAVLAATLGSARLFSHETLTTTVLFDREIVHLLNDHCVMCHAQGGPSFPLESYEQTWLMGRKMRATVIAHQMPPWAPIAGFGQFANDNSLTLRETQFVVSWVEGLGPRNSGVVFTNVVDPNAHRRPPVRAQPKFGQWSLGEPDLTRALPPTTIEPDQSPNVVRTVIDLGLTTQRRFRSVQFMPGDRRVVRAAFFTVRETGQWIGSWTPWYGFMQLPANAAFQLAPGSHVVAEIHYQPTKERIVDRGTLGLSFSTGAASAVSDTVLDAAGSVSPGAKSQRFHTEAVLTVDTAIVALWPELHSGVKSIEVSARKPDGSTEVLLFAKDIPLDWPTPYIFKDPVVQRRGTTLVAVAYYENTRLAPRPGGFRLHLSGYPETAAGTRTTTRRRPQQAPPVTAADGRYNLTGKVVSVDKAAHKLTVDHQPIPGLMGAMTMAYTVNDPRALENVAPGDPITATVVTVDNQYLLENIVIAKQKR